MQQTSRKTIEERLKKEEEQIEKRKRRVAQLKRKAKEEAEKRLENYKFYRGGLVHIAGLLWINPNVLLGALLSDILPTIVENEEEKIKEWETAGKMYHSKTYKGKEREEFVKNNEKLVELAAEQNNLLKDIYVR